MRETRIRVNVKLTHNNNYYFTSPSPPPQSHWQTRKPRNWWQSCSAGCLLSGSAQKNRPISACDDDNIDVIRSEFVNNMMACLLCLERGSQRLRCAETRRRRRISMGRHTTRLVDGIWQGVNFIVDKYLFITVLLCARDCRRGCEGDDNCDGIIDNLIFF